MSGLSFGSCLCGSVKYQLEGEFESFYLCHCRYCQKDTGSAHAANLFTTKSKFSWLRGKDLVKTYQLTNSRHVKSFCQNCGSAVPTVQKEDQLLVVPAGSLDGPVDIKPNGHLFISSARNNFISHRWYFHFFFKR